MNDIHKPRDHRLEAARAIGCHDAARRGWSFDPYAEPSFSVIRILEVLFRPATLISLAALALSIYLLCAA